MTKGLCCIDNIIQCSHVKFNAKCGKEDKRCISDLRAVHQSEQHSVSSIWNQTCFGL